MLFALIVAIGMLFHSPGLRNFKALTRYFGCGTIRRYGLGDFQPLGYFFRACSFETEPPIITSLLQPGRRLRIQLLGWKK